MQVREAGEEAWLGRPAPEVPELDYPPVQTLQSTMVDTPSMTYDQSAGQPLNDRQQGLVTVPSQKGQLGQTCGERCICMLLSIARCVFRQSLIVKEAACVKGDQARLDHGSTSCNGSLKVLCRQGAGLVNLCQRAQEADE